MTEEESLADAPAQQSFVRRLDRAVARLRSERIKSQESSSADLVRQVAASARGELPAAPAEAENSDAATEYSATEHGFAPGPLRPSRSEMLAASEVPRAFRPKTVLAASQHISLDVLLAAGTLDEGHTNAAAAVEAKVANLEAEHASVEATAHRIADEAEHHPYDTESEASSGDLRVDSDVVWGEAEEILECNAQFLARGLMTLPRLRVAHFGAVASIAEAEHLEAAGEHVLRLHRTATVDVPFSHLNAKLRHARLLVLSRADLGEAGWAAASPLLGDSGKGPTFVLASLWDIGEAATPFLTTLAEELRASPEAPALAFQRAARTCDEASWAPFVLLG